MLSCSPQTAFQYNSPSRCPDGPGQCGFMSLSKHFITTEVKASHGANWDEVSSGQGPLFEDSLKQMGIMDWLKFSVNTSASWSGQPLIARPDIPSGPAAFLVFTILKLAFVTITTKMSIQAHISWYQHALHSFKKMACAAY